MSPPRVSVVVPCYAQAHFLPDALASLQAQSLSHWECIVVNDGSPDDTRGVVAQLSRGEKRLKYVEKLNGGLSSARNAGVAVAQAEYIQFLDADDRLEPDKLARQVEYLDAHAETGIVYGDARYFTTEQPDLREIGPYALVAGRPWIPDFWSAEGDFLEKLVVRNACVVSSPLVRRSILDRVGTWNESLQALEDWEFWIRCAARGVSFYFLDTPRTHALIRIHDSSMTTDAERMHFAGFQMRTITGPYIHTRESRTRNFAAGLMSLRQLGDRHFPSRLLALARANSNVPVTTWTAKALVRYAARKVTRAIHSDKGA